MLIIKIKNITELISPERLWSHHRTLCTEIGSRLLGTENDRRAAGYIEACFARLGLITRRQEYDCPSWEHESTLITSTSGLKIEPPEGGASMFSLPCDVSGEMVAVQSEEELKKAELKNKICVLSIPVIKYKASDKR